jgi:hypothetical protein
LYFLHNQTMEKRSINQNRDLNSVRFQGGTFRPPQK